ncbi:hypothetical protein [Dactylosporangium sp. NPDC000521]|uniref:hypothetical protein n=1 Tax=Dactylosporangium sp. NPDC000521 TaxID=3363975 RepID=UPI0036A03703
MSLSITMARPAADGTLTFRDVPDGVNDSAVGEGTRRRRHSSQIVRDLGAVYLPRLADDWLVVPPEETVAFLRECALVLAELPAVTAATRRTPLRGRRALHHYEADESYIERCLMTIMHVTHLARCADSGIVIW